MIRALLLFVLLFGPLTARAELGTVAAAFVPGSVWQGQWQARAARAQAAGLSFDWLIENELNGEMPLLQGVRRGRIAIAPISFAILSTADPALSVLMTPYLFEGAEDQDAAMDRAMPRIGERLAAVGLVALGWHEVGPSNLFADRPLMVPGDAAGLRMRGPENIPHQAFLGALGADRLAMNFGDFITALQTGLVEGGVATAHFHANITARLSPHYTLTGHIAETGVVVANRRWWQRLDEATRNSVRALFDTLPAERNDVRAATEAALTRITEQGATIHRLDADQQAAWRTATAGVEAAILAEAGEGAAELLAMLRGE